MTPFQQTLKQTQYTLMLCEEGEQKSLGEVTIPTITTDLKTIVVAGPPPSRRFPVVDLCRAACMTMEIDSQDCAQLVEKIQPTIVTQPKDIPCDLFRPSRIYLSSLAFWAHWRNTKKVECKTALDRVNEKFGFLGRK